MTRAVKCGPLVIGGGAKISVQSMTNTDTRDCEATGAQIARLFESGCDLVRVSVFDEKCVPHLRKYQEDAPGPLSADIHFDARLAVAAVENGFAALRINPGNIGSESEVERVVDCCKAHGTPIRIGVNSGSLEKDILNAHGGVTAEGMVESALRHVRILEKRGFEDIVISLKSTDLRTTVDAYRRMAKMCGYPLHVGMTEAGLPGEGSIRSAIGIGALLLAGIGDTIRVSLTGDPALEAPLGISILKALGLRGGFRLIACPTCGRTRLDTAAIAARVEEAFRNEKRDITVAVMGCVVNGPGEARGADVALCGGVDCGALYIGGEYREKLTGDVAEKFIARVRRFLDERDR